MLLFLFWKKEKDINAQPKTSRIQIGLGEPNKAPFSCPECIKLFASKQNMNRHIKGVHENLTFTCTKCGNSYTRNFKLYEHISKCTDPSNIISAKTSTNTQLNIPRTQRGLEEHNKVPFSCPECMKKFGSIKSIWTDTQDKST